MNGIQTELQALLDQRQSFLLELQSWPEASLKTQPDLGGWCALEVVDHILNSEKGTLGYVLKKTSSGFEGLQDGTPENDAASAQLNAALESDSKWGAPAVLPPPDPNLDLPGLGAQWSGVHAKMEQWIAAFPQEFENKLVFRHPLAGRLTLAQTLGFLQRHIAHHRFQLERIKTALAEQSA